MVISYLDRKLVEASSRNNVSPELPEYLIQYFLFYCDMTKEDIEELKKYHEELYKTKFLET